MIDEAGDVLDLFNDLYMSIDNSEAQEERKGEGNEDSANIYAITECLKVQYNIFQAHK